MTDSRVERILKGLILDLHAIDITCNFSEDEEKEAELVYAQAKSALAKLLIEGLPEKKDDTNHYDDSENGYDEGYNQALDDVIKRIGEMLE